MIRVHYTAGVRARFETAFIASIFRYEIETGARKVGHNANRMVRELEQVEARKLNGTYIYTHVENDRLKDFLRSMQVKPEDRS